MTSKAPVSPKPTVGGDSGVWGNMLNAITDDFAAASGGILSISASGSSYTRVLTNSEAQNLAIIISDGGLTASGYAVYTPSGVTGSWIFYNNTPKILFIVAPANNGRNVVVNPYSSATVYSSDGNSIYSADTTSIPAGTIISFAGPGVGDPAAPSAPAGYLVCDGTAFSSANFPALYAAIGTKWNGASALPPGTDFRVPNLLGQFVRGSTTFAGVGAFQAGEIQSHTHTDAGHSHGVSLPSPYVGFTLRAPGTNTGLFIPSGTGDASASLGISINTGTANIQATGGSETRPPNYSVLYCIAHGFRIF